MKWLVGLLINAAVLIGISFVFDGFSLSGYGAAFVASLLLSIVNAVVRPILIILTLPITVLTLGLFLVVINALTLMLTALLMGSAFVIDGFGIAVLASILIAITQTFIVKPIKNRK